MSTPPPVPLIAEAERVAAMLSREAEIARRSVLYESDAEVTLSPRDADNLASLLQHLLTYCRAAAARN